MKIIRNVLRLVGAALKRAQFEPRDNMPPHLPSDHIESQVTIYNDRKLSLFHRLVNWSDREHVHPCWLHIHAFGFHLDLMLQKHFPLPLMGLVHLENQITQYRPVVSGETLTLTCWLANPRKHRRGWTFEIVTRYEAQGSLVWEGISTQLYRCKHPAEINGTKESQYEEISTDQQQTWCLAEGLGRQYAKVSGDFNPIHLYRFSARLLGFERQIAHGMWTKARCMSALDSVLTTPYCFSVQFRKPVFLPANLLFSSVSVPGSQRAFRVTDETGDILHLTGSVCAVSGA